MKRAKAKCPRKSGKRHTTASLRAEETEKRKSSIKRSRTHIEKTDTVEKIYIYFHEGAATTR